MSKRLAAGVVGVGVAWSYFSTRHEAMKPLDPSEISGRIWMDSKPKGGTEYVQGFFLMPAVGYATFQRSSTFDHHIEISRYKRSGEKLALTFPQTGKTSEVTVKVTPCSDLPPFDLCLDLSSAPWGETKRYYATSKKSKEAAAVGSFVTLPSTLDDVPAE